MDEELVQTLMEAMSRLGMQDLEYRRGDLRVELHCAAGSLAVPAAAVVVPSLPAREREVGEDGRLVRAGMAGIFYRSSAPGAEPYATEGARVEGGATLGMIEVMKILSRVCAPSAGTVVAVLAEDGAFVEAHTPLFRMEDGT
ncbi:acetyl-CoA carboxylase biotin carboxyl carrier protein [Gluconacetobacter sp. Hr-1-5]|uniref:acetyl-CoA carboxylase biotin carboxyl carrier protein n=1 Tax=Gluconacetobacter sp. Hr-1-5 TaxID=3395370 RepID=UPI003B51F19F